MKPFQPILAAAITLLSIIPHTRAQTAETQPRIISADLSQPNTPLVSMFNVCIGAGRANEGLRADWQQQLTYAHRECGFQYIRMHGLFTDDMGVFRIRDGKPQYNWQYIDQLYDFLESIGMKPFVELSFMPKDLASGQKTVFWWHANVTPPTSLPMWGDFIKAFVEHVRERYGDAEVRTWYFEVWNEPNLAEFWAGNQQQYFDLYATTARAIKSVSPSYRVGGPATAGCAWVPEFIRYCNTNQVPLDFITTHTYAVDAGFLDQKGTAGTVFSAKDDSISAHVLKVRKQISDSPMPKLDLHFTEWSSSYTPSDPIHDTYLSGAFILDRIKKSGDAAQSLSYWTFTDIFEEAGPRWEAFHGGFGLINYQSINKPSFYAYQFLNKLGHKQLSSSDPSSWVTEDDHGNIQALFWDYTYTEPKGTINQVYYKQDLPTKPKGQAELLLKHLPAGNYKMSVSKIGYRINDPYDTYLDMGAPAQLTRQQVAEIKSKNNGGPSETHSVTIGKNGEFRKQFDLRENDVVFVTLSRSR